LAEDAELHDLLRTLSPSARDDLRNVLIRDQANRDAVASRLMRYRDENGQGWADIIDFLTMWPDARRRVARVLGEIDGTGHIDHQRFNGVITVRGAVSGTRSTRPAGSLLERSQVSAARWP
jgi:hypothetical protein